MNDNSVIISSIEPRIGYYATAAGITNIIQKKEYQKKFKNNNITEAQLLDCIRCLEACDLAMGDRRTTEKMYLERDVFSLKQIGKQLFPTDKTSGRNFVDAMKQNIENNTLEDSGNNISSGKTFTKVNNNSSSYKVFSDIS